PANGGLLAPRDGDFVAGNTLSLDPTAAGTLDFDYACVQNADARFVLQATNGDASTNINLRCTKPQGQIVVVIDDSACAQLQADGASKCLVKLDVHQNANGVTIPFTDNVDVKVTGATPKNTTDAPDSRVLSSSTSGSGTSDDLSLTPVAQTGNGHA